MNLAPWAFLHSHFCVSSQPVDREFLFSLWLVHSGALFWIPISRKWTRRELNPRHPSCEEGTLPLSYAPNFEPCQLAMPTKPINQVRSNSLEVTCTSCANWATFPDHQIFNGWISNDWTKKRAPPHIYSGPINKPNGRDFNFAFNKTFTFIKAYSI